MKQSISDIWESQFDGLSQSSLLFRICYHVVHCERAYISLLRSDRSEILKYNKNHAERKRQNLSFSACIPHAASNNTWYSESAAGYIQCDMTVNMEKNSARKITKTIWNLSVSGRTWKILSSIFLNQELEYIVETSAFPEQCCIALKHWNSLVDTVIQTNNKHEQNIN